MLVNGELRQEAEGGAAALCWLQSAYEWRAGRQTAGEAFKTFETFIYSN
ncbi:hypothetical protein E2C01_090802 [Portunus trituberculatus]|uniref:Uncharacterized protein n=1 Tax=Portunus trituberculatus TaxID=210409 RepID=A0A5B7JTD1_PORTR|nr:hypothetical protein [Portunus trituberculatus]